MSPLSIDIAPVRRSGPRSFIAASPRAAAVLIALLLVAVAGCHANPPLDKLDRKYTRLMVRLNAAARDTARNIKNKEARRRKTEAEQAIVAFFQDKRVQEAIAAARKAPEGTIERAEGDAYWRQMMLSRPWTADDKAREQRLLARLEKARSMQATWTSPDGKVQVGLDQPWHEVSKAADKLSDELRAELAREWTHHQVRVLGQDLQDLVRLRNKVARRAGWRTYWELSLASQGLQPADVDRIIDELVPVVRPFIEAEQARIDQTARELGLSDTFANHPLLRRKAGLATGRQEADDIFDTDLAESRIRTAFHDMGIPTEGWEVYTGPTRYVRPGADGWPIRPPLHVAIVMSQDRRWSVWQYEALAHEGGHTVWWMSLSPDIARRPALWSPPPPWFEGFAQFFERLVFEPGFSARYVPELSEQARQDLYRWRVRSEAESVADSIVETQVERRLYEDPTSLEAVSAYAAQLRTQLTGASAPDPDPNGIVYDSSLTSSLLWNYPAYSQNYLFADVTEAWMYAAVKAKVGDPLGNPDVGPFIVNHIVRAPVGQSLPERLGALLPVDRIAPFREYLATAPVSPAANDAAK